MCGVNTRDNDKSDNGTRAEQHCARNGARGALAYRVIISSAAVGGVKPYRGSAANRRRGILMKKRLRAAGGELVNEIMLSSLSAYQNNNGVIKHNALYGMAYVRGDNSGA